MSQKRKNNVRFDCMNKRGDTPLTLIFTVLVFIFIWVIFLAQFINASMEVSIQKGGLTGLIAFFFTNYNLLIGFVVLIFLLGYAYYVSQ